MTRAPKYDMPSSHSGRSRAPQPSSYRESRGRSPSRVSSSGRSSSSSRAHSSSRSISRPVRSGTPSQDSTYSHEPALSIGPGLTHRQHRSIDKWSKNVTPGSSASQAPSSHVSRSGSHSSSSRYGSYTGGTMVKYDGHGSSSSRRPSVSGGSYAPSSYAPSSSSRRRSVSGGYAPSSSSRRPSVSGSHAPYDSYYSSSGRPKPTVITSPPPATVSCPSNYPHCCSKHKRRHIENFQVCTNCGWNNQSIGADRLGYDGRAPGSYMNRDYVSAYDRGFLLGSRNNTMLGVTMSQTMGGVKREAFYAGMEVGMNGRGWRKTMMYTQDYHPIYPATNPRRYYGC